MNLTRHTDYALRVLMYLGSQPERLATISEIAEAYAVSRNHLMKVVHELGRAGLVRTVRGHGGGIELGRDPVEINVGVVVRLMEGNLDIIDCAKPGCPIVAACGLRGVLDEARDAFLAVLDSYSLQDLIQSRRTRLKSLLRIDTPAG
ncbi:Rrf2 family transcriptional regulator [Thiohalomonas denitrificans]|uniref:Transcriptional regulator, BadM/Rrf2 family n=1 Tax=Thiohalomonas denitrificans TaxID=415747 RepID=A0A1G5PHT6_9GAMM|nr:Rrf2 family transcriptional regulator [Thiohalomonas denitrificans]SCZ49054.1 transcriptional regulator, BadM/Rrf2 family [Thiohalomonas denitrificans]